MDRTPAPRAAGVPVKEIAMIEVGQTAPDFELPDHLGRTLGPGRFRGRRHVMLLFYPLDFTPT